MLPKNYLVIIYSHVKERNSSNTNPGSVKIVGARDVVRLGVR
jgi:hypothetical protein